MVYTLKFPKIKMKRVEIQDNRKSSFNMGIYVSKEQFLSNPQRGE
jgi:hypothetical protein